MTGQSDTDPFAVPFEFVLYDAQGNRRTVAKRVEADGSVVFRAEDFLDERDDDR